MVTIEPVLAEATCVQQMAVGNQGCACWIRARAVLVRQGVLPVRGWTGDLEWEQLCFGEGIKVKALAAGEVTRLEEPWAVEMRLRRN